MDPYHQVISEKGESYQNKISYMYEWTIHNFSCTANIKGVLPTKEIAFKLSDNLRFEGYLALIGDKCMDRYCRLYLKRPDRGVCNVTVRMWLDEETTICQVYNHDNIIKILELTRNGSCKLAEASYTIKFEVTHVNFIAVPRITPFAIKESTLRKDLIDLFEKKSFWDVTFVVTGNELHAHKGILASRSKVFATMFEFKAEDTKLHKVIITDIEYEVFQEMLRFIYTDEVLCLKELASQLLFASVKYDLPKLKSTCVHELANKINIENAAETLIVADLNKAKDLKDHVIGFIKSHKKDVANTDGWQKILKDHLHLLAEICVQFKE